MKKILKFLNMKLLLLKEFDRNSLRNQRISYYTIYTVLFILMASIIFSSFYLNGKSLIWSPDGILQYYNSFMYFGTYLRGVIGELISTGLLQFPMWDFHIGYGSDIITTLHYYVIGDPLGLLSGFIPESQAQYFYTLLIIFRLYLAGISFSVYCNSMGKSRVPTLCGAFTYAFCGYALMFVRDSFFLNPMIYFPLILLGVEKIFNKKKPYLLIIMIFISAVSNFYFFYMITIFTALYCILRCVFLYRREGISLIMKYGLKITGFVMVGILLASVILLPVLLTTVSTGRMEIEPEVSLFYPLSYYIKFVPSFISMKHPAYALHMGYTAVALLAVIVLFTLKRQYIQLKIAFLALTIMHLFPFFGYIFNGFSYVTNRWVFVHAFVTSMIIVVIIPHLLRIEKKQFKIILIVIGAFVTIGLFSSTFRNRNFLISLVLSLIGAIMMRVGHGCNINLLKNERNYKFKGKQAVLGLTLLGIIIQSLYIYTPMGRNYTDTYVSMKDAQSIITDTEAKAVQQIEDPSFYRYDENRYGGQSITFNSALPNRVNSMSYYFSLANPFIFSFMKEMALDIRRDFFYGGTDSRAVISTLASSKYFVIQKGLEQYLPYGYDEQVWRDTINTEQYHVYKNKNALPLGYTYDSYLSREDYNALSPLKKQQALLQGGVLEQVPDKIHQTQPEFNDFAVDYTVDCDDGIALEDGKFVVKKRNAKAKITFVGPSHSETYYYLKNLHFKGIPSSNRNTEKNSNDSFFRQQLKDLKWTEPNFTKFKIATDEIVKTLELTTPKYNWYMDKHDFLVHLQYSEKTKSDLTLSFDQIGEYSFDEMQILSQPVKDYTKNIQLLKQDVLEDVQMGINNITGHIFLNKPKLLTLSIPYSPGWIAYVNGEKTPILRTNTMYSGLLLDAGDHTIELRYVTPGLVAGSVLSSIGATMFIGIVLWNRRHKRQKIKNKDGGVKNKKF